MEEELQHFGILGMKWGRRKQESSTSKLAKSDAQRHMDAKMFYGDGAGTKRKLLKAEIDKKRRKIPGYSEAFDAHLQTVDTKASADRAVRKRVTIDTVDQGRRLLKKILGVTGGIGVALATTAYYANKESVDAFMQEQFQKIINRR